MTVPERGITVRAHIDGLMTDIETATVEVFSQVRTSKRLRAQERKAMSRRLAGVIARCETMRIWLGAGAP